MSGRIIPTIWGKGWGFPGIGPTPTFRSLIVSLITVMVLVGVSFSMLMYYNEHIMKPKVHWESNLPPSWTWLVLNSFCHVLWLYHSFKGCTLPPSLLFQDHLSFVDLLKQNKTNKPIFFFFSPQGLVLSGSRLCWERTQLRSRVSGRQSLP